MDWPKAVHPRVFFVMQEHYLKDEAKTALVKDPVRTAQ